MSTRASKPPALLSRPPLPPSSPCPPAPQAHLRLEAEVRERRAAVDDAQHALASEQAAAEARSADAVRELERLKLEMERRHAEAALQEALQGGGRCSL